MTIDTSTEKKSGNPWTKWLEERRERDAKNNALDESMKEYNESQRTANEVKPNKETIDIGKRPSRRLVSDKQGKPRPDPRRLLH